MDNADNTEAGKPADTTPTPTPPEAPTPNAETPTATPAKAPTPTPPDMDKHPAPWRLAPIGEHGHGYIVDSKGRHVAFYSADEADIYALFVSHANELAERDAARRDWLSAWGTGVKFSRFKGADRRVLVAEWRNDKTGEEHLYELRVRKEPYLTGTHGKAEYWTDGRLSFSLTAPTVAKAETLAVSAAMRCIRRGHRKSIRTAQKARETPADATPAEAKPEGADAAN